MKKTIAAVHVFVESTDVCLRVYWIPDRISLVWNTCRGRIKVILVVVKEFDSVTGITEFLNVESKANTRLIVIIRILRIPHVVPNLLFCIELQDFVWMVYTRRQSLLLTYYDFKFSNYVKFNLIVLLNVSYGCHITARSHFCALGRLTKNTCVVLIFCATSIAVFRPEVIWISSVKVSGALCNIGK